jgi:hypothetical protein
MTDKKTPTIQQLLDVRDGAPKAQPAQLRTIWNTRCGSYPASALIAVPAEGAKSARDGAKKTTRLRAKSL